MAILNGAINAQRIQKIVEAKEHFVWATTMEDISYIFGVPGLGKNISGEMTDLLKEARVLCYPNPLPTQKPNAVILVLEGSQFGENLDLFSKK